MPIPKFPLNQQDCKLAMVISHLIFPEKRIPSPYVRQKENSTKRLRNHRFKRPEAAMFAGGQRGLHLKLTVQVPLPKLRSEKRFQDG